jgi:cytochrome c oxidase subunit III
MAEANELTADALTLGREWKTPDRGTVGIIFLIVTESVLFLMFAVVYLLYIGQSVTGPYPKAVLETPIAATVCLLSSSFTIILAEHALERSRIGQFRLWWAVTICLGLFFLYYTGMEWKKLIFEDHLTISTNLFGTTFYSLVGLHASHVTVGMFFLLLVMAVSLFGFPVETQKRRIKFLSWYWHFVDAVWVVVFTVVYIISTR